MDIKSKNNRRIFWAVMVLALCSLLMLASFPQTKASVEFYVKEVASETEDGGQSWPNYRYNDITDLKSFIRYMYMGSYGMYWELQMKEQGKDLEPDEVYFPGYGDTAENAEEARQAEDHTELLNERIKEWYSNFQSLLENYLVEYRVVDKTSGESVTNSLKNLEELDAQESSFYLKMSFDETGAFQIEEMTNQSQLQMTAGEIYGLGKKQFLSWMDMEDYYLPSALMAQPENVDVYIYSGNPECYLSKNEIDGMYDYDYLYYTRIHDMETTGYVTILSGIFICVLLFPMFRKLRKESRFLSKISMELAVIFLMGVILANGLSVSFCRSYVSGGWAASLLGNVICFCIYLMLFGIWMVGVMALLQVFDLGVGTYLRERCFLWKNFGKLWEKGKEKFRSFIQDVKTVDLSDQSDKWLIKLVVLNFAILFLCCLFWFWGVFGLVIYSLILFFILRKYLKQVKEKYGILLKATSRMAQGELHVEIEEDLGLLEPLKEELAKVSSGFSKAVEEEIRSQNMKTELITNVSHDLKTPLTAIITYVNLLKEENLTPEEQRSYVDILDRKSLRLKKLIEDLFEVSKATSGNIQINKTQVDLGEMVRQAVMEQQDRMEEAGIECRVSVPEEPVQIQLDGEKTYRILENLLVNVTKYGMAGTRAWVTLAAVEDLAEITVKNISATELEEDVSYLTERFVRGDKSRNTEGSGLGLAIVKSFTELQGGKFRITTDGDLFKAIVTFPRGG